MFKKVKARKTALLGMVLLWAFLSDALANQLQDISFSALPGNRVEIVLTTSEPVGDPASFTTDNPARIAIDLANTTSALSQKVTPVAIGMARSVTAIEAGDRTRVVINLLEQATHEIRTEGNKVIVSVGAGSGAGSMSATTVPQAGRCSLSATCRGAAAWDWKISISAVDRMVKAGWKSSCPTRPSWSTCGSRATRSCSTSWIPACRRSWRERSM